MSTYDILPYDTRPSGATHPDRAFAVARLHGLDPGPPDTARVLELGCGTGLNLAPMAAALPDARFVGIDLSSAQIAMGREHADALGLSNLELRHADLRDAPEGPFDLVIAHGLYSWVPPVVRDALMAVVARVLAPTGVAFVSWNALPGWGVRGALRDVLRRQAAGLTDPIARVRAARALLDRLEDAPVSDPFAALVRERARALRGAPDAYVLHDYLAEHNEPVWIGAFRDHAAARGLAVLSEAELGGDAPPPGCEAVLEASADPTWVSDALSGRSFHRTLLCHARQQGPYDGSAVAGLMLRGRLEGLHEGPPWTFGRRGEPVLATENALLAAALSALQDAFPGVVPFGALHDAACEQVRRAPDGASAADLARALGRCAAHGFVGVHARAPAVATRLPARPEAFAPARHLAARGSPWVPGLLHRAVAVDAADRLLLQALDGSRDRDGVLACVRSSAPDLPFAEIPGRLASFVSAGLVLAEAPRTS